MAIECAAPLGCLCAKSDSADDLRPARGGSAIFLL